jgi:predicted transcriptional regulator
MEVLQVLWDVGSGTVRELIRSLEERGYHGAYTTVSTLLQRLKTKGYVTSEKVGVAYVFRPVISREKLLHHRLWELAEQFTGGMATPLVHALVEGHRFTGEEIKGFRRLLDGLDSRSRRVRKDT